MTEATKAEKPELLRIESIDTFVSMMTLWHGKKVAILEHMLNVPSGTIMEPVEGQSLVLEGAMLDGFKAGLGLALMELGQLPFVVDEADLPIQH